MGLPGQDSLKPFFTSFQLSKTGGIFEHPHSPPSSGTPRGWANPLALISVAPTPPDPWLLHFYLFFSPRSGLLLSLQVASCFRFFIVKPFMVAFAFFISPSRFSTPVGSWPLCVPKSRADILTPNSHDAGRRSFIVVSLCIEPCTRLGAISCQIYVNSHLLIFCSCFLGFFVISRIVPSTWASAFSGLSLPFFFFSPILTSSLLPTRFFRHVPGGWLLEFVFLVFLLIERVLIFQANRFLPLWNLVFLLPTPVSSFVGTFFERGVLRRYPSPFLFFFS